MTSTTHIDPASSPVRTYGGWRRARGIGLFGAGPAGTAVVLGCVLVPMLCASVSLPLAGVASAPAAVLALLTLTRVGGVSIGHLLLRRTRWTWATARGWRAYRATTVDHHLRAWDLPGVLAPTRLLTARDAQGTPFGVVWNRRTGYLTATLRCAASSTWLVDDREVDSWIANWHAWLASLGYLPMVRAVAVTVETAPETGTTLRDAVRCRLDPGAPADTRALMQELVAHSPSASAEVDTRVSVTFDPAGSARRLRDLDDAVAEVSRQLAGLESALDACGVTVLGRLDAPALAGIVRVAFDPAARETVEQFLAGRTNTAKLSPEDSAACPDSVPPGVPFGHSTGQPRSRTPEPSLAQGSTQDLPREAREDSPRVPPPELAWDECGPIAAHEDWDCYRHDSGISVSWCWLEAPRRQVTSAVLARLLSPGRFAKRVTLVYRPLPAADAARLLEAQVNAAAFRDAYRQAQRRAASARDIADRLQAQRAAAEEAQGAGVVLMSLYVTATVTDPEQLPEAVVDVESRADQCAVRLRRLHGGQAAGFACTLPVGVAGVVPLLGRTAAPAGASGGGR